jgi:hypothetical protein
MYVIKNMQDDEWISKQIEQKQNLIKMKVRKREISRKYRDRIFSSGGICATKNCENRLFPKSRSSTCRNCRFSYFPCGHPNCYVLLQKKRHNGHFCKDHSNCDIPYKKRCVDFHEDRNWVKHIIGKYSIIKVPYNPTRLANRRCSIF